MTNELDLKLSQLKELEDGITKLQTEKEALRVEVFETLAKEELDTYKSDIATISKVERKSIKFLVKPEDLIKTLPEKYIELIPERKELNKKFEQEVKDGIKFDGVELETKETLTIRFNK